MPSCERKVADPPRAAALCSALVPRARGAAHAGRECVHDARRQQRAAGAPVRSLCTKSLSLGRGKDVMQMRVNVHVRVGRTNLLPSAFGTSGGTTTSCQVPTTSRLLSKFRSTTSTCL